MTLTYPCVRLKKWLEDRRIAKHAKRFEEGWQYAERAVHQGPMAIAELQHHIDSDYLFGSRDAFTDGAQSRLRMERL